MIGADAEAIDKAEDRLKFKDAMTQDRARVSARSAIAHTEAEALGGAGDQVGLPAIIRPSRSRIGGTGGGVAYNRTEFLDNRPQAGLDASADHRGADRGVAARLERI